MSEMHSSSSPGGSYTPPPTPPSSGTPAAGGDRQLMLVLSYLGILGLIPLIARSQDREIRWHSINGLAMFGAYLVIAMLLWVMDIAIGIPCAGTLLSCGIFIAYLALAVFGIMKALKGERLRLPVLSDLADKQ